MGLETYYQGLNKTTGSKTGGLETRYKSLPAEKKNTNPVILNKKTETKLPVIEKKKGILSTVSDVYSKVRQALGGDKVKLSTDEVPALSGKAPPVSKDIADINKGVTTAKPVKTTAELTPIGQKRTKDIIKQVPEYPKKVKESVVTFKDTVKGFVGEFAASSERTGAQSAIRFKDGKITTEILEGNPNAIFVPENEAQQIGAWTQQYGLDAILVAAVLREGIAGIKTLKDQSKIAAKLEDFVNKELKVFQNKLSNNPLTKQDIIDVTTGKASPETLELFKKTPQAVRVAIAKSDVSPKTKVSRWFTDQYNKFKNAIASQKEDETKLLPSGEKPIEKPSTLKVAPKIDVPATTKEIVTYSGGNTGFSTPNKPFAEQFGETTTRIIKQSEVLDTRVPAQKKALEGVIGKEKLETMIARSDVGLPNHFETTDQSELITAAKELGYKYIALSETDKTTKFNGQDVISYASTEQLPTQPKGVGLQTTGQPFSPDEIKTVINKVAHNFKASETNTLPLNARENEVWEALLKTPQYRNTMEKIAGGKLGRVPEGVGVTGGEVKPEVEEVKPKEPEVTKTVSVPREQLPVGEGEKKVSQLAERVKKSLDSIKPDQIESLGETKYKEMNNEETIKAASEYVIKNPEEAIKVLKGDVAPPKGLPINSIYVAMANNAVGNFALATKLATLRSTRLGQEIEILKELTPNNPITIMSEIYKVRADAFQKRYAGKSIERVKQQAVDKGLKKMKPPKIADWGEIIKMVRC